MTASSQTPPGALPPELTPVRPPMPDAERAAYAAYGAYGAALPAPTEPEAAEAPVVTTLQAAAAVMDAAMKEDGAATGEELAAAEQQAGLIFDAASVQAAVDAAREQARAEYHADIAELGRQVALTAGDYRRVQAVLRLCEGHRGDDMLLVSAVAVAAECGTTALDGLPMTLTWTRSAHIPEATDTSKRVIVECTSSYGGRADLVVEGEDRMALASLLDTEAVRDITAPCPQDGCGTTEDIDPGDPAVFGWARLQVAGLGDEPRWYCSPPCISNALARAGAQLAIIEDQAELDGGL